MDTVLQPVAGDPAGRLRGSDATQDGGSGGGEQVNLTPRVQPLGNHGSPCAPQGGAVDEQAHAHHAHALSAEANANEAQGRRGALPEPAIGIVPHESAVRLF